MNLIKLDEISEEYVIMATRKLLPNHDLVVKKLNLWQLLSIFLKFDCGFEENEMNVILDTKPIVSSQSLAEENNLGLGSTFTLSTMIIEIVEMPFDVNHS